MTKALILALGLAALATSLSSCSIPCGEPFWKKNSACESAPPAR